MLPPCAIAEIDAVRKDRSQQQFAVPGGSAAAHMRKIPRKSSPFVNLHKKIGDFDRGSIA
jgi:hypothetical protein